MRLNRLTVAAAGVLLLAMIAVATTQLSRQALAQTVSAAVTGFLDASGATVPDSVANPHPIALGGIPYAMAQSASNSQLQFDIPAVAGKYFYLTSFQVEGNGATAPGNALVSFYNMSGGTGTNPTVSYSNIVVPGNAPVQMEYNKIFPYPWQSAAPGVRVIITVAPFGVGNTAAAGRIVGYYQ